MLAVIVAGIAVLILVLMEDTLRAPGLKAQQNSWATSLNPCFNGRYSQSMVVCYDIINYKSLNPCFNGRYSQREVITDLKNRGYVLILVLMEDTLRDLQHEKETRESFVLILVLMEDTLRGVL